MLMQIINLLDGDQGRQTELFDLDPNLAKTFSYITFELLHQKTNNLGMQKQRGRSVIAQLIGAFVFAIQIEQSLFFLHSKFQVPSLFLWLCMRAMFTASHIKTKQLTVDYIYILTTLFFMIVLTCYIK